MDMRIVFMRFFRILLLLLTFRLHFPLILRVRQPNGMLVRVQINGLNSTLQELHSEIKKHIEDTNSCNISISGTAFSFDTLKDINSTIDSLKLKSGDVVSLHRTDKVSEISRGESTSRVKIQAKKASRASIADLEKRKKGLFQLKIPKADLLNQLQVSNTIERILTRIGHRGGIALLLGHVIKNETNTASANKNTKSIAVHKVLAAAEIECGNIPQDLLSSSSQVSTIRRIESIASNLGLKVLGCCMSTGDKNLWSESHVFAGIQIQHILGEQICPFVVLSISNSTLARSTQPSSLTRAARVASSYKIASASANAGSNHSAIHCEGFILTNQTFSLVEKKLIALKKQAKNRSSKEGETISLEGPICVKNDEVTSIDPIFLAAPIAVSPLEEGSRSGSLQSSTCPAPMLLGLEHSFPTPAALSQPSPSVAAVAKGFLRRLLKHFRKPGGALPPEARRRLLDPHLLLHLGAALGEQGLDTLLSHLDPRKDSALPLSTELCLVMDGLSTSLEADDLPDE